MCISIRLLEHGELVGIYRFIFVHASLDMPACKVAAIAAGKSSRAKAADRNSLPIAVVNISRNARDSGIAKWKPQGTLPCSFRNRITTPRRRGKRQQERAHQNVHRPAIQKDLQSSMQRTNEPRRNIPDGWGILLT